MAIRLPLTTVLSSNNNDEVGAGSVNGVVSIPFTLPIDMDNLVVKMSATMAGGGVSAQLQTTDDGGTTWFGVARTSIVSAATGDAVQWLSVPVSGFGVRSASIVSTGSIVAGGNIGNSAPSTLSFGGGYTGLPILSQQARIVLQLQAGVTSSSILTQVKVNSQAPHA